MKIELKTEFKTHFISVKDKFHLISNDLFEYKLSFVSKPQYSDNLYLNSPWKHFVKASSLAMSNDYYVQNG